MMVDDVDRTARRSRNIGRRAEQSQFAGTAFPGAGDDDTDNQDRFDIRRSCSPCRPGAGVQRGSCHALDVAHPGPVPPAFPPIFAKILGGKSFTRDSAYYAEGYAGAALWLPPDVQPDDDALTRLMQRTSAAPA
jgi:hypothetical protein